MDKITTLSEAILIGSSYTKQCFGAYIKCANPFDGASEVTHACAIGAAWLAAGLTDRNQGYINSVGKRFSVPMRVLLSVTRWNDELHMTRENIAARLKRRGY